MAAVTEVPRPTPVGVAVCQVAPRLGERRANHELVETWVRRAAAAGAGLVVLPELVTSGYALEPDEVASLAEPADGPTAALLTRLAGELGVVVVAGVPERRGDVVHNSAVLVDGSGLRAVYRKVHLWDREPDLFTPGDVAPPVVETAWGRVGMAVCYDLEFPEWVRGLALDGADIVCAPTNWPAEARPPGERPVEVVRAQALAAVNRVFVAVADRVGAERGVDWLGGSVLVGPDGYPLAGGDGDDGERLLLATCDLARARDKRTGQRNDAFADRRPALYRHRPTAEEPQPAGTIEERP